MPLRGGFFSSSITPVANNELLNFLLLLANNSSPTNTTNNNNQTSSSSYCLGLLSHGNHAAGDMGCGQVMICFSVVLIMFIAATYCVADSIYSNRYNQENRYHQAPNNRVVPGW